MPPTKLIPDTAKSSTGDFWASKPTITGSGSVGTPATAGKVFTPAPSNPTGPLSNGGSMSLADTAAFLNGKGIATPAYTTPSNKPSSSASIQTNTNVNNTTTNATTQPSSTPSDNEKLLMDYYHMSLDDIRKSYGDAMSAATAAAPIRAEDTANKAAQDTKDAEQARLDAKEAADLAQQDEEWAQLHAKIESQRNSSLQVAKGNAYAANPFASTSSSTIASLDAVNKNYDTYVGSAMEKYQAAKQMAQAGYREQAATIMADLNKSIQDNAQKTIGNETTIASQAQQTKYQNETLDLNTQTRFQTAADKEAQGLNDTQANALNTLPQTIGDNPTSDQLAILNATPGYSSLIKAGYTPNDAKNYLIGVATDNKQKIADQKLATQTAMNNINIQYKQMSLLDKQNAGADLSTLSSVGNGIFTTAFSQAGLHNNYSKQQSTTGLSNLASFAATGDVTNLKSGLAGYVLSSNTYDAETYNGLTSIAGTLQDVRTRIVALPKDQQTGFINGNVTDLAAKFGQSTDPGLRTIAQELNHIVPFYAKMIGGVRGAASAVGGNASSFASLIPNIKESKDLLMSDLNAFVNTASDLTDNAVASRITQPVFDQIYGSSGVLGSTTGAGGTVQSQGKTYTIGQVYNDGTANWTIDSKGVWSKQ